METNNLVKSYASKAAQTALFRSVYLWMTLALVITGFVAMYIATGTRHHGLCSHVHSQVVHPD